MTAARRTAIALATAAGLVALPATASATDWCIGTTIGGPSCQAPPSGSTPGERLRSVLDAAEVATKETRIYLGAGTYRGEFTYGGAQRLAIQGAGPDTVVAAAGDHPAFSATARVELTGATLRTSDAQATVLELADGGYVADVALEGAAEGIALGGRDLVMARLRVAGAETGVQVGDGASLVDSRIAATRTALVALPGTPVVVGGSELQTTDPAAPTGSALVNVGTTVFVYNSLLRSRARGGDAAALDTQCAFADAGTFVTSSTLAAAGDPGVRAKCDVSGLAARTTVDRSILAPGTHPVADSGGRIELSDSRWDGQGGDRITADGAMTTVAPGFVSVDDLRLRPDSPLVDGDLGLSEGTGDEDAAGLPRTLDGDGDGIAKADLGAYETAPAAGPPTAGNVLVNGDAEQPVGGPGGVPGWTVVTGPAGVLPYDGDFGPRPSYAEVFGGGSQLFGAVDAGTSASLAQTTDVTARATAIDGAGSVATLSGLLGAANAGLPTVVRDRATVTATFRDAAGQPLGASLTIGPLTGEQLGYVSAVARRTATATVPSGTRSVETVVAFADLDEADRPDPRYATGYADELSLTFADNPAAADPASGGGGSGTGDGGAVPSRPVAAPPVLPSYVGPKLPGGRFKLDAKGRVTVPVACPAAAVGGCVGTLELSRPGTARAAAKRRKKAVRLARARVAVAAGKTQRVKLKLSRKARRGLRKSTKVTLRLVTRDGRPGAKAVTRTRTVRLTKR